MKLNSFNLAMFELAAQQAAATPIVPVHDPNPRYPLDMSMGEIERSIRVSAEHFGHPVPVEIGEGAARRLRELVETPEPIIVDDPIDIRECAETLRNAAGKYIGEPYAPTFHAPPRGRVVSQAKGPNRAQRRARR